MWRQFVIGYTGYGSLIDVLMLDLTSCDHRVVFQYGTGLVGPVTQDLKLTHYSLTQTNKQTNKQTEKTN